MLPAFDYQISQHNERIRRIEIEARRRASDGPGRGDAPAGLHQRSGWQGLRRSFGAALARSSAGRAG